MTDLGSLVPMIALWPGVTPRGERCGDLVDFTDILPTLADVAGTDRPAGADDGVSFADRIAGRSAAEPRDWVLVQSRKRWFVRGPQYSLHEDGRLVDVSDPFDEREVTGESAESERARTRLANVADALFER